MTYEYDLNYLIECLAKCDAAARGLMSRHKNGMEPWMWPLVEDIHGECLRFNAVFDGKCGEGEVVP